MSVQDSNPGRGKKFCSPPKRPEQLVDSTSLLFNGHRGSLPAVKRSERKNDHSLPSDVEVTNEYNLYDLMLCK